MPVQSQIITCPAGQWTAIAQYMDTRQALMVQCPEQATTLSSTTITSVAQIESIVAANVLRRMIAFATVTSNGVTVSTDLAGLSIGTGQGYFLATGAAPTRRDMTFDDGTWGRFAAAQWYALWGVFPGESLECYQEIYTCRAVILGINTAGPTGPTPNGTAPQGIWTSGDLGAGGTTFRLDRQRDHDLTIQEWFAWPVGSGNVNVQVFQAFDLAPPPDTRQISIAGPRLTYGGLEALKEMLAEYGPGDANAGPNLDQQE